MWVEFQTFDGILTVVHVSQQTRTEKLSTIEQIKDGLVDGRGVTQVVGVDE